MTIIFEQSDNVELARQIINKLLSIPNTEGNLNYAQIRRTAARVIDAVGHEWVFRLNLPKYRAGLTDLEEQEWDRIRLERNKRSKIETMLHKEIINAVKTWHKSPSSVWYQFYKHSLYFATREEANNLLKNYRWTR